MYQVGDHVFYPMHGAGKIEAIEKKEIAGEKQLYYVIRMLIGNMTVMLPEKTIAANNIRPVTDLEEVKEIVTTLEMEESDSNLTWQKRYNANMEKIKSGNLQACVEVVSSLLRMQQEDKLNSSERLLLNRAKEFLLSELNLVEGMNNSIREKFISMLRDNHPAIT